MEGISWKRAYAGSLLIHLVVAGLLAVGLAGSVAQHEQEKMYVVDLDASDLTDSGSGHAGGGGGGSSSASLFPDKLSETDMAQRTAAVQAQSSALTPPEQVTQAQSILAEASEKAAAPVASAAQAPLPGAPSDTGSSTAAGSRDGVPAVAPGRAKATVKGLVRAVGKAPVPAVAVAAVRAVVPGPAAATARGMVKGPAMARAAATAVLWVLGRLLLTAMVSGRLSMPISLTRLWPSSGA